MRSDGREDGRVLVALALARSGLGEHGEGEALARRALELEPTEFDAQLGVRHLVAASLVSAQAGDAGRTVERLRQAYGSPYRPFDSPSFLLADPRFDLVRSDERFQGLVAELQP